jgi:4'-phosphopantetheinyl transferase
LTALCWLEQRLADVPEARSWLSAAEAQKAAALRVPKRRDDWLLGRWTAKRALLWLQSAGDLRDMPRAEVRAAASGVPELFWDGARAPFSLSISHSAGRALVALAPVATPVGCDLETIEPHTPAFLDEAFTAAERAAIEASPSPVAAAALCWSAKESVLKVLGEGLRLPLQDFEVSIGSIEESPVPWRPFGVRCRSSGASFAGLWSRSGEWMRTVAARDPISSLNELRVSHAPAAIAAMRR